MSTRKPKADPLLATPDGTRATSAWLTKVQAAALAAAEAAKTTQSAYVPQGLSFLATNPLDINSAFAHSNGRYVISQHNPVAVWECLLQWHGEAALASVGKQVAEKDVLKWVCTFRSAAAQDLLLAHLWAPLVREAVAERALLWPIDTLRRLLAQNPSRDQPAAQLLQLLLHQHPDWLAPLQAQLAADSDDAQAKTLARLLAVTEKVTDASADELPAMLREPPWRAGAGRAELPVLALSARPQPATIDWPRWAGGDIEPRPRVESYHWEALSRFEFADPQVLIGFVAAQGWLEAQGLEMLRAEIAAGPDSGLLVRFARHRLNVRADDPAVLETIQRFLQTTCGLTDADAERLRRQSHDEAYWDVGPHMLELGRRMYQVEEEFQALLSREGMQGSADDPATLRALADAGWGKPGRALYLLGVKPERVADVLASGRFEPADLRAPPGKEMTLFNHLGWLSDELALALLRAQKPKLAPHYYEYQTVDHCGNPAARLLKRFGPEHIDLMLPALPPESRANAQQLMDIVDWDGLALHLSEKGFAGRLLRPYARRWLLARPRTAARALIPPAFSADAKAAAHARYHLYALAKEGHADALRAEAAAYGAEAEAAVAQLLTTPPENLLPAQVPKLPAWLNIPRLPRLLLAGSGHAVPLANMPDALMPLALAKGGMAYAGLDKLQEAVTPDSLARLMRGLFEQWAENEMPAKDRWIFELQGRLGDDATARLLAPAIRQWRSHLDRVRSYEGLEMLTQIGSDTALMLLASFTEQKRYTDLQDRAAKALTRVAEERGLTLEELADRTVPTLGLDERGRLPLDFGTRQFSASLAFDLTPQVFDADGARLKDLPKPGAKDDAALAKAASSDWKELKKQAKLVAQTQVARLESAMCAQRRWQAGDFMLFFAQHPVLRTLTQRLVWAQFNGDELAATFRVSEDLTLADAEDTALNLPEGARIGLPHPLELTGALQKQWQAVLADYELMQPFEQLTRATYALPAEHLARRDMPGYAGRKVGTGSLFGLEARGWKRGVGDGGMLDHFSKPLGQGRSATLGLVEGWFIAGAPPASSESHELRGVFLEGAPSAGGSTSAPTWADLSPITVSELLRDLEKMAWHTQ